MMRSVVRDEVAVEAPPGQAPRRRFSLRTFRSLKLVNFRYYMASSLFQMAAMNMQTMASGWFMYKLTGSAALLGVTMLANAIPQLLLSLAGGIIADRASKKAVLLLGLVASSLIVLWIAISTSLGIITWHYLVVSSFLQGTVMAMMMPARQAMVPELVGRDNLMNAVALNMAGMNMNRLGAPALAGFIIAGAGVEGVYYLMAALYLTAAVLALPLRQAATGIAQGWTRRNVLGDLKDGLTYIRDNRNVAAILVFTLLGVVLSMPYVALLPVFAESVLRVGPQGLGLLMSASGLGAVIGSFYIASRGSKGRGMLYIHTVLLTGVALLAFSASGSYALSLVILVAVGLGQAGRMALNNILLQSYTEDAYLGRVMSLSMMEWGVTSLGSFVVALIAQVVGVQWAVGGTSALLVMTALYYYAFSPRIRRLD
ncbi:MAG: MFS transporter [Chloroflexi bacterium]|nr:MFS transporter [Chloroflexota bacterium]